MDFLCIKCNHDINDLINWDNLFEDYIECPKCKHKMTVEYDVIADEEGDENPWYIENYIKNS